MNTNTRIMAAALVLCAVFAAVIIGFLAYGRGRTAPQPAATASVAAPAPAAPGAIPAAAPATPDVPGGAPTAKILVIDRQEILRASAVGKDILKQLEVLSKQAESEFAGEENKLRSDAAAAQRDSAILSADVKAQKQKDFANRQAALQRKVQVRQAQIQGAFANAQHQVEATLAPILQQVIMEKGANMLVDRSAIVFSMVQMDITNEAVQRLDKALPTVKVTLATLPAGAQLPPPGEPGEPGAAPGIPQ